MVAYVADIEFDGEAVNSFMKANHPAVWRLANCASAGNTREKESSRSKNHTPGPSAYVAYIYEYLSSRTTVGRNGKQQHTVKQSQWRAGGLGLSRHQMERASAASRSPDRAGLTIVSPTPITTPRNADLSPSKYRAAVGNPSFGYNSQAVVDTVKVVNSMRPTWSPAAGAMAPDQLYCPITAPTRPICIPPIAETSH
jgi:hypothetical protein